MSRSKVVVRRLVGMHNLQARRGWWRIHSNSTWAAAVPDIDAEAVINELGPSVSYKKE